MASKMKRCEERDCVQLAMYRYSAPIGGEKLACAGHAEFIVSDGQRIGVRVDMVLIVPLMERIVGPAQRGIET